MKHNILLHLIFRLSLKSTVLNMESLFLLMVSDSCTDCFQTLFSIKSQNCLSPTISSSYMFCATVLGGAIFVSRSNRLLLLSSKGLHPLKDLIVNFSRICGNLFELIQKSCDALALGSYFH